MLDKMNVNGIHVVKKSGKPFKSGNLMNTIKSMINHPITNRPAYLFYDDDSYVECRQCEDAFEFLGVF